MFLRLTTASFWFGVNLSLSDFERFHVPSGLRPSSEPDVCSPVCLLFFLSGQVQAWMGWAVETRPETSIGEITYSGTIFQTWYKLPSTNVDIDFHGSCEQLPWSSMEAFTEAAGDCSVEVHPLLPLHARRACMES